MRVLLVEDASDASGEVILRALTKQNYTVDISSDNQSAWEFIEAYDYDLLILNKIRLQQDGVEFCHKLRQSNYQMPILFLTSQSDSAIQIAALDAGADDYVVKPFDIQELVARIRALSRRGKASLPPVLKWGELHLDPSTCEAAYKQQALNLTPKEYSLLKLFLSHGGHVFSRGAIIASLWAFDDPPTEETIKSHVKSLRQKLRAVGAPADFIETIYGLGYRLNPLHEGNTTITEAHAIKGFSVQDDLSVYDQDEMVVGCQARLSSKQEVIQTLERFLAIAKRYSQPLGIAVLEVENFNQIKNQNSSVHCDQLIDHIHQFLQQVFRRADVVAHWDGSEYVVGMYDMSNPHLKNRMAEILRKLDQIPFHQQSASQGQLVLKVGTAIYPQDGADLQSLLQTARQELLQR